MSIHRQKGRLRAEARERRRAALRTVGADAAERLRDNFAAVRQGQGFPTAGAVISGYWPMDEEMDVRPLLQDLHAAGFVCALPAVVGRHEPLIFRRWRPGASLEDGTFGTRHPGADAPEVRPDVVLAPLLAYDSRGNRMGWGGGYYDRTLRALRRDGPLLAVGVAFAAQQVDAVPHTEDDQPLDWIVTEEQAMRVGAP